MEDASGMAFSVEYEGCAGTPPCDRRLASDSTPIPAHDYQTMSANVGFVVIERSVDRFGQAFYAFGIARGFPGQGAVSMVQGVMQDRGYAPEDTDRFLTGPAITFQIGGLIAGKGVVVSPLASNSSTENGGYTPQVGIAATWGFRERDVVNWKPPWQWW